MSKSKSWRLTFSTGICSEQAKAHHPAKMRRGLRGKSTVSLSHAAVRTVGLFKVVSGKSARLALSTATLGDSAARRCYDLPLP